MAALRSHTLASIHMLSLRFRRTRQAPALLVRRIITHAIGAWLNFFTRHRKSTAHVRRGALRIAAISAVLAH
jgi:hypothetical protein